MSDEESRTQIRPEREWTVDTIKAYVDAINRESDLRVDAAIAALERLVEAVRVESDRRYEDRFLAQEKAVEAALTAAREATTKAEAAAEKRFDSVNEFRAQLSDQAATFMPRIESENRHATAAEKISDLTHRMDKDEGHNSGVQASLGQLLAIAGVMVAVLTVILRFVIPPA